LRIEIRRSSSSVTPEQKYLKARKNEEGSAMTGATGNSFGLKGQRRERCTKQEMYLLSKDEASNVKTGVKKTGE